MDGLRGNPGPPPAMSVVLHVFEKEDSGQKYVLCCRLDQFHSILSLFLLVLSWQISIVRHVLEKRSCHNASFVLHIPFLNRFFFHVLHIFFAETTFYKFQVISSLLAYFDLIFLIFDICLLRLSSLTMTTKLSGKRNYWDWWSLISWYNYQRHRCRQTAKSLPV